MKTKTKWIEDGAVTVPKLGAFDSGSTSEKATPVSADRVLINDSADSNNPKWAQVGNLPGSGGDPTVTLEEATSEVTNGTTTDTLASSMTKTPASGDYVVTFSGVATNSVKANAAVMSIYAGGSREAASERYATPGGGGYKISFSCEAKVTVNGSQAIEGKFKTDGGGTASIFARQLKVMKVA